MYSISFIGSGNVAFRLSIAFQQAGHTIECICGRNIEKAEQIVRALHRHKGRTFATADYQKLPDSDIIIIAVSDNAISEVSGRLNKPGSLIVHTSGATALDTLTQTGAPDKRGHYGVLYPLMTLSKNKDLDVRLIPFLIEASDKESTDKLIHLVNTLKAEYKICRSEKRLQMHTAAVFATNFINYMLTLACDISHPDYTFLLPAATETVRKAFLHTPLTSQTGPALRRDVETIRKHLDLLEKSGTPEQAEIYKLLTERISERYTGQKEKKNHE